MDSLKQKSIDAVIWNLLEKYGNQVIGLIIGVILARLLTPADYGLIGMITVFFALAMVFVNSGFGTAYIQKKDANETDASTIFFFNIFVSAFFYVILWFVAPLIANFYNQDELVNLIRVMAIVLIISSFSMIQITKLVKEVNFKKKAIITLVSTLISGVVGITAALNGFGVWSLVIQKLIGTSINAIGLWKYYKWRPQFTFSMNSLKEMFAFSSWVLFANIMRTIFDNIYILTIGKFFPVAQLGFYTKAKGYQKIIIQQPTSAIGGVSFPIFSKLQDDKYALKNSMRKFSQHTLFFIAPIIALLIVIANPLIFVVLTNKWMPMVPYLKLLLIGGFFYPINLINLKVLTALGKTNLNFRLEMFKNVLRLVNIIVMYRFGVLYIIYGEVFLSFLATLINGYYAKSLINYGIFEQLKDVLNITISIIIIIFIGNILLSEISNDYYKIIIGTSFVIISYLISMYFLNKTILIENWKIIKNIKSKIA